MVVAALVSKYAVCEGTNGKTITAYDICLRKRIPGISHLMRLSYGIAPHFYGFAHNTCFGGNEGAVFPCHFESLGRLAVAGVHAFAVLEMHEDFI